MTMTVEHYLNSASIKFPVAHPNGWRLSEFEIECSNCEGDTRDLKGTAVTHSSCLELKAGAVCDSCKLVTFSRARFYKDHILFWDAEGDIVEHSVGVAPWYIRLIFWLKGE